ncbi:hypothetical protein AYI69_g7887 [Smittium culicis]|uniref:Uncharacterized protein n=1 Tax=Smittium culicis TaxID=133412 RepID=A0A1R1XNU6_9FUNG|nr:hypothetical protein AYI69_g7887 [Smittium culicis]
MAYSPQISQTSPVISIMLYFIRISKVSGSVTSSSQYHNPKEYNITTTRKSEIRYSLLPKYPKHRVDFGSITNERTLIGNVCADSGYSFSNYPQEKFNRNISINTECRQEMGYIPPIIDLCSESDHLGHLNSGISLNCFENNNYESFKFHSIPINSEKSDPGNASDFEFENNPILNLQNYPLKKQHKKPTFKPFLISKKNNFSNFQILNKESTLPETTPEETTGLSFYKNEDDFESSWTFTENADNIYSRQLPLVFDNYDHEDPSPFLELSSTINKYNHTPKNQAPGHSKSKLKKNFVSPKIKEKNSSNHFKYKFSRRLDDATSKYASISSNKSSKKSFLDIETNDTSSISISSFETALKNTKNREALVSKKKKNEYNDISYMSIDNSSSWKRDFSLEKNDFLNSSLELIEMVCSPIIWESV